MKNTLKITPILVVSLMLAGCLEEGNSAEVTQKQQTKELQNEANRQVGMPAITNFTERKFAKQILEMRDKSIATHTYIMNQLQGCLIYVGSSVGYGLPYAVQFTNPMKIADSRHNYGYAITPQADPNGLYMPDSLSATWVLLYDGKSKIAKPVYMEQEITVAPFKLVNGVCHG